MSLYGQRDQNKISAHAHHAERLELVAHFVGESGLGAVGREHRGPAPLVTERLGLALEPGHLLSEAFVGRGVLTSIERARFGERLSRFERKVDAVTFESEKWKA